MVQAIRNLLTYAALALTYTTLACSSVPIRTTEIRSQESPLTIAEKRRGRKWMGLAEETYREGDCKILEAGKILNCRPRDVNISDHFIVERIAYFNTKGNESADSADIHLLTTYQHHQENESIRTTIHLDLEKRTLEHVKTTREFEKNKETHCFNALDQEIPLVDEECQKP